MLAGTQVEELCAALFSAFPTLPAFDLMLLTRVNQRRERLSTGFGVGLPTVIAAVVAAAEKEFWTPSLLAGAQAAVPANPDLQAFFGRYPALDPAAAPAARVNHYAATFLVGRRVFLNRPGLRGHLVNFGQGLTSRVLIVNGPRGSGKTYSKTFIGYLHQFEPAYQAVTHELVYVDLDTGATDLESTAALIGRELEVVAPMPPRPTVDKEQKTRWVPALKSWLRRGIEARPAAVVWLVIDGSRLAELSDDETDLIDGLGDFADTETGRLRLVLLNYNPGTVLISLQEQIPKVVVTRADVEQFISTVYSLSGKTADAARVTQAVNEILRQVGQQVAATEPYRELEFLSRALRAAADQLLG